MRLKVALLVSSLALCLIMVVPATAAARPVIGSQWTSHPPTIDGVVGSGEWANLQLSLVPSAYPIEAYVYVLNDASNLYFLVDAVGDSIINTNDECLLVFNWNENSANWVMVEIVGNDPVGNSYSAAGGFGKTSNSGTDHRIYEFSIPFALLGKRPGDAIDFCSPPLSYKHVSMPYDGYDGRDNVWPSGLGGNEGNINYWGILNAARSYWRATPGNYVGGELFSANKLAVLSPYLALIGLAGVVASAAIVTKKRRRE